MRLHQEGCRVEDRHFSPQRTQGRSKSPPLRLRSGEAPSQTAREGVWHSEGRDPEWGGQQAEGERDTEIDNFQHAVNRDAYDAEREQQQPYERVCDQSQERQGPAQDEEDAPEQECEHGGDLLLNDSTSGVRGKFRGAKDARPGGARSCVVLPGRVVYV